MDEHNSQLQATVTRLRRRKAEPRSALNVANDRRPHYCASLPHYLTISEAASLLRISEKALYCKVERAQLPGAVRLGPRALRVHTETLLDWLHQQGASSR